jgi:hypothetical protein
MTRGHDHLHRQRHHLYGWSLWRIEEALSWWDRARQPRKLPFLSTKLALDQPFGRLSQPQHDVLFAACVEMAIGLRPYNAAMR